MFLDLWDKFEKSGLIEDYLEYCKWNDSLDITNYIVSENYIIESGDLSGFTTNSDGYGA